MDPRMPTKPRHWRTFKRAGLWLVALLVAVFPANIYMAVAPERAGFGVAPVWLWPRLPLQPLLIAWVLWVARTSRLWGG